MDTWRALLNARDHWYPIMLQLHRFTIAVSRVAVNHDGRGGSAPDPLVWEHGSKRKQRKADIRVNVDLASLLGPPGFSNGPSLWFYYCLAVSCMLCKFTTFWCTLHRLAGAEDLGHFGASFLEVWILFEQWAGRRLLSEKVFLGPMFVPTALFLFLLFLFQKELKLGRNVSLSAAW